MNAALHYRHRYYSPAYAARVDIDGTPLLDDLARRYLPSGACVLDVGAGAGGRKHPCREPGIRLVGIDPSPLVTSNPDLDCCVCHPAEEMPFECCSTTDLSLRAQLWWKGHRTTWLFHRYFIRWA